jgi:hypothetical protein
MAGKKNLIRILHMTDNKTDRTGTMNTTETIESYIRPSVAYGVNQQWLI